MSYPIQYLILFSPPAEIKQDIAVFKSQFRASYGHFEEEYPVAHVEVGGMLISSGMEDLIFATLAEQMSSIESFRFRTNGFYQFSRTRTIYAHMEECGHFDQVTAALRQTMERYHLQKSSYVADTPHLTIAERLDRKTFNKAYCFEYSFKPYDRTFGAYQLTVMRRSATDQQFEVFRELPLQDDVMDAWFEASLPGLVCYEG